jgi:pyruvate formate lyase activating enzyme
MRKEAMLYESLEEGKVHCSLCHQDCVIAESKFGFCGVRENQGGKLYTHVYGEVIAAHVDPIEKKPLYHFLPGSRSFSIATPGCNFRCGFCQNWQISQLSKKKTPEWSGVPLSPREVLQKAKKENCLSISYTYTEPTIFFEYAYDTSRLAKEEGLYNVFVTNGFMTSDAIEAIHPFLDAANVDLKSFREDFYKKRCHGHLEPVLGSIRLMKEKGIWVEITTLVIPDENDEEAELRDIARFISGVDPDIPWHISRFHPDYQLTDSVATPLKTLEKAYDIGKEEGLRYVYLGNVPGDLTKTDCPHCGESLIKRAGFHTSEYRIENSLCSSCGGRIAGVFR